MKLNELFLKDDVRVNSSWIDTLDYQNGNAIMKLDDGRSYVIVGVPEQLFNRWVTSPSKGRFWHDNIKITYKTFRQ